MDWLTFIAEIAKALAWPSAIVVLALLFRQELQRLLRRIRKGKIGSAELDFEQVVLEIRQDLPPPLIAPQARLEVAHTNTASERRATIIEAWLGVEAELSKLARKLPGYNALAAMPGTSYSIAIVTQNKALAPHWVVAYQALRKLRNQAVHDEDFAPSIDAAAGYAELANELKDSILLAQSAL